MESGPLQLKICNKRMQNVSPAGSTLESLPVKYDHEFNTSADLADLETDAECGSFGTLIAAAPQVRPAGLKEIRLGVLQLLQLIDEPLDP